MCLHIYKNVQRHSLTAVHTHVFMHMAACVYTCLQGQRQRERQRQKETDRDRQSDRGEREQERERERERKPEIYTYICVYVYVHVDFQRERERERETERESASERFQPWLAWQSTDSVGYNRMGYNLTMISRCKSENGQFCV